MVLWRAGDSRVVLLSCSVFLPPGFMIYTGVMQTSRHAAQIEKLKERRQELATKARDADKRLADRLRRLQTDEAKVERKRETRRKIIVGAIVRAAQTSRMDISLRWLEEQIQALERPDDRALFSLDVEPSAGATDADKAAPITARQKKLLAELVEEHPRFARELGVDPDDPGLEKLGKAKATYLIGAMVDHANAQAPPDGR